MRSSVVRYPGDKAEPWQRKGGPEGSGRLERQDGFGWVTGVGLVAPGQLAPIG